MYIYTYQIFYTFILSFLNQTPFNYMISKDIVETPENGQTDGLDLRIKFTFSNRVIEPRASNWVFKTLFLFLVPKLHFRVTLPDSLLKVSIEY